MDKLNEAQIKAIMGGMTDGPGMQYNGWAELKRISGSWQSEDGALVARIGGSDFTIQQTGGEPVRSLLRYLSNMSFGMGMGMTGMALNPPAIHELDFVADGPNLLPEPKGEPKYRYSRLWLQNGSLTLLLADLATGEQKEVTFHRTAPPAAPIDTSVAPPKFCTECGTPMNGAHVCPNCGWHR